MPHLTETDYGNYRPKIPKHLDLSSFPLLDTFSYSYFSFYGYEKLSRWAELVSFLSPKSPISNFRAIVLCIYVDGQDQLHNTFLSSIGKHYPWGTLDNALATGHFTGIESVYINLNLTFYKATSELFDSTVVLDDIAQTLRADIMGSFSRSKTLSIPIDVDVDIKLS